MPVHTRSRQQSTLSFPCRKTQNSMRSALAKQSKPAASEISSLVRPKDHCRSRSLPSLSPRVGSSERPKLVGPLSNRLTATLSPRKRNIYDDENRRPEGPQCSPAKVKKALVSEEEESSPMKSPRKMTPSLVSPLRKLSVCRPDVAGYSSTKRALHTSQPDRLLCREKEIQTMETFLRDHVPKKRPGSLYISGPPGTGKTACLKQIIHEEKSLTSGAQVVFVNCMLVRQSQGIYNKVLKEVKHGAATEKMSAKMAARALERAFTSKGPTVLLILDEIDHLDSKGQEVLYTMFEWPSLPKSRLVLIGVANALDLTDRILPRLQARPRCKPQLLHFAPYTRTQISTILEDRLKEPSLDGIVVVEPPAVQLCARKVAAVAGDIRKALDVCRRAVEIVEADVRGQTILKPTKGSPEKRSLRESPKKTPPKPTKKVGLLQISNVINEVYGSGMTSSSNGRSQSFPLQQKLAICTLLLMVKEGKSREVMLGKVHDAYRQICYSRQVTLVDQSEFLSLCQLIETRGVLSLKKSKDARQSKMCLKLTEAEVEFALQDKVLTSAILQAGLPGNKDKKNKIL